MSQVPHMANCYVCGEDVDTRKGVPLERRGLGRLYVHEQCPPFIPPISVDYWFPSNEPKLGTRPFATPQAALSWAREFCSAFGTGSAVRFHGFVPDAGELAGITTKVEKP